MKNNVIDYAIIGGGFSGVIIAIMLGERTNSNIILLEKNDRLCKKIPSTGNGRGNLSNCSISKENYHGDKFLAERVLDQFPQKSLIEFFKELGVLCVEENGKLFPSSMQASSISDMMRYKLDSLPVNVKLGYNVKTIQKKNDLYCINNEIFAKNLIVCAGGASMKNFGTDGNIFPLLDGLKIKSTPLKPSLVQIKTQTDKIKGLKGIKQNAVVTLLDKNEKIVSFEGDLLFTDFGVSGDTIFKMSAYMSEVKEPNLKIEFIPSVNYEGLKDFLVEKSKKSYILNKHLPVGVVQNKLGLLLLKLCNENPEEKANEKSSEKLAKLIKNFSLIINGTLGFDNSQVTHGGVDTSQINFNLKHKTENIYFAGEVLNVDGDCGGYNLQFAYSSACVVAESIINGNK